MKDIIRHQEEENGCERKKLKSDTQGNEKTKKTTKEKNGGCTGSLSLNGGYDLFLANHEARGVCNWLDQNTPVFQLQTDPGHILIAVFGNFDPM